MFSTYFAPCTAVTQVLVRTSLWDVQCFTTRCTVLHQVMYGTSLCDALEPAVRNPPPSLHHVHCITCNTGEARGVFYGSKGARMGAPTPTQGPLALCGHFRPKISENTHFTSAAETKFGSCYGSQPPDKQSKFYCSEGLRRHNKVWAMMLFNFVKNCLNDTIIAPRFEGVLGNTK